MMKRKVFVLLAMILVFGIIGGCGKNETEEMFSEEQYRQIYFPVPEADIKISQQGNYFVNGVELSEALMPREYTDETWEGYSVEELGLLPPEKMPGCYIDETGTHTVIYDGEVYVYANDMNEQFGDNSGMTEYADVWCSITAETVQVLGGWEEYGRACAERRE